MVDGVPLCRLDLRGMQLNRLQTLEWCDLVAIILEVGSQVTRTRHDDGVAGVGFLLGGGSHIHHQLAIDALRVSQTTRSHQLRNEVHGLGFLALPIHEWLILVLDDDVVGIQVVLQECD